VFFFGGTLYEFVEHVAALGALFSFVHLQSKCFFVFAAACGLFAEQASNFFVSTFF